jgi:hypothetical protein
MATLRKHRNKWQSIVRVQGHPKGLLQTEQILEGRLFFFKEINN